MSRGAFLDLIFTNNDELTEDVKVKDSLACRDHEVVEFRILRAEASSQPQTSGKQTLDSSKICFEESHKIKSWRVEKTKKTA